MNALKEVLEERVAYALPSQASSALQPSPTPNTGKVFIVHGHDNGVKETVARFIEKFGLEAVILHEQLDQSRTVIEKLLDHAVEADYAIALFTPDDIGYPVNNPDDRKHRARQNVVLELGLFLGFLGRKRVALLHTGDVDIPSDFSGVLYVKLDGVGAWETKLAGEMKKSGMAVDLNNLIGI
ncbi:MAG: nucleotide-binding protein [Chlorobaculum sp.]|nr:nucleotide-binding protein [Chlorobaculum sp.]